MIEQQGRVVRVSRTAAWVAVGGQSGCFACDAGGNVLFYFAMAPRFFGGLCENLYKAGSAKTTDVLDAQNGLRMARFNLLSARFGYLTALVQRDRAVGAVK